MDWQIHSLEHHGTTGQPRASRWTWLADFQAKRFAEIPEMVAKLDAAKAKVARLYTRWEELEALREESA